MNVRELLSVLIYFPPDGQDVPVRFANGDKLEGVQVIDADGKLCVELKGSPSIRSKPATRLQYLIDKKNHALAELQSELDRQASTKTATASRPESYAARRSTTAALNGKSHHVLKTITDRNEIQRITKTTGSGRGCYQIR